MKRCIPVFVLTFTLIACSNTTDGSPQSTSTTTKITTTYATSTSLTTRTTTQKVESTQATPVAEQPYTPPAQTTFDPNSADGYGPNQKLPPLCERFPGQFDCNGNPIAPAAAPSECVGFGCSPEQDAELARIEHGTTAQFWDCMNAGGTEESCLQ